jgi:acetylglutamate kinase
MINVVKVGGGIIEKKDDLKSFLTSFAALKGPKVLVHGGGRLATVMAEKLGIETKMVEGRRITDAEMLDVVTMIYGGLANKNIVAALQGLGVDAIGLSGADGNLIQSHKRNNTAIDYGFVGDIDQVNAEFLNQIINLGKVPVVAPLTHDKKGTLLNTNADTIASSVATALAEITDVRLILGFELDGVLSDSKDKSSVINKINPQTFEQLKSDGIITDGMIPKMTNAFSAIQKGVKEVKICHALKVGEANDTKIGTTIVA